MDFLRIEDLSLNDINHVFDMADKLKENDKLLLNGKTFVLFFPESSIRTRLSFEKGIKSLGGECILFPPSTLDKREALVDVVNYIKNWADGIVVRHKNYDIVSELAASSDLPIVNAMTSKNHPCEILSDLYSLSRLRDDYTDLTYTFVGSEGNIVNSWVSAANVFNLKLNHVSYEEYRIKADSETYSFLTSLEEALKNTDVVLTDPLPKVLRNKEYYDKYQITEESMTLCNDNALLNPCPPFFRGEEVSEDVINSDYFVGYEFKKNLIYVQQAIILYCLGIAV